MYMKRCHWSCQKDFSFEGFGLCAIEVKNLYHFITPFTHIHKKSLELIYKASEAMTLGVQSNPQDTVWVLTNCLLHLSDSPVGHVGESCISPAVDHFQRQRGSWKQALWERSRLLTWVLPTLSVPLSRMHSSHCVGSAVVAIPHFVSHFHNFLPICNNWHSPSLPYKTQPQKGYYKITFSVHWLATSVRNGIVHFGEVEKLQLFLVLSLRRFVVWTWKDLKWTTVCFYLKGTSSSRYLQIE